MIKNISLCLLAKNYKEWQDYHRISKEQIFDPINVKYDPKHPSITNDNNYHFILFNETKVVTIAHIEFLNETDVALRKLATDLKFQSQGYGKLMLSLLEEWLKDQNIKLVKMHARMSAENFYRKLGYQDCEFNDPCISEQHVNLGKNL